MMCSCENEWWTFYETFINLTDWKCSTDTQFVFSENLDPNINHYHKLNLSQKRELVSSRVQQFCGLRDEAVWWWAVQTLQTSAVYQSLLPQQRWEVVVAEWLRRWTRNPLGSPRAGLNPADNELLFTHLSSWTFHVSCWLWRTENNFSVNEEI